MPLKLSELDLALESVSGDPVIVSCVAYIHLESGEIFYESEDFDGEAEELPDDIGDSNKYMEVPTKQDLDLGKPLVIKYSSEAIPDELDKVYDFFSRRGAYQRYKELLSGLGKLDDWYEYEAAQQKKALIAWCDENDLEVVIE